MQIDNPMRLVRELKPCELKVYLIVYFSGQPVSNAFIERWTGYSDKPVSQALGYLAEIGLVVKGRQGWVMADGAMQLPLPVGDETNQEENLNRQDAKGAKIFDEGEEDEEMSRNISDSEGLINTTTNTNLNSEELVIVIKGESRNFSDSEGEKRAALEGCGVAEPKLSSLARLDYDAGEILALDGELKKRKGARYGPGLLIHAMEHGQRAKKVEAARRYDEGEFAEFIDN